MADSFVLHTFISTSQNGYHSLYKTVIAPSTKIVKIVTFSDGTFQRQKIYTAPPQLIPGTAFVCLFVCFQFVLSGLVRISSY